MRQRLTIIGFVVIAILAVLLLILQQQALNEVQLASTAAARSEQRRVTAVALAQEAAGTQAEAEAAHATAEAQARSAGTTAARAEAELATMEYAATAGADDLVTEQARLAATAEAQSDAAAATVTAASAALLTAQADFVVTATSGAEIVLTAQEKAAIAATGQAAAEAVLATATAETDRLAFALEAAQEDLTLALNNIDDRATAIALLQEDLATAQSGGGERSTLVPTAVQPTETTGVGSEDIPPLTATFTSESGNTTFKYPNGWLAIQLDNGVILVGSSEDALLRDETLLEGDYVVQMVVNLVTNINDLPTGSTPADVVGELAEIFASPPNPATLGAVTELTIDGRDAALVAGEQAGNDFRLFTIDLGSDIVLVAIAYSAPETMEMFEPVVRDMLASFEFVPPSSNP